MRISSLAGRLSVAAWLILSVSLAPGVALAQPTAADLTTALAATEEGRSKRAIGDHAGALTSFETAHALLGAPTTGLDVAVEQEALGLLVEALDTAQSAAIATATGAEDEGAKREALALAAKVSKRTPLIKVALHNVDPGTELWLQIDGRTIPPAMAAGPLRINPGERTIEIAAVGYDSVRHTVRVMESVTVTVDALLASDTKGGAQDARAVPEAVLAMIGQDVVLGIKKGEARKGTLLSANTTGFALAQPDHGVLFVARSLARKIQLDEGAPDVVPAPAQPGPAAATGDGTPRTGVLSSYFLGIDAGFLSFDPSARETVVGEFGGYFGLRLGVALWDQWAISMGFGGMFLKDTNPFKETVTDCTYLNGNLVSCEGQSEQESTIRADGLSFESGYQRRFRPWPSSSLLPGLMVGYAFSVGGIKRGVDCEGCQSFTVADLTADGVYVAPSFRITIGESGFIGLSIRSQWFLTGDLRQLTTMGIDLGWP